MDLYRVAITVLFKILRSIHDAQGMHELFKLFIYSSGMVASRSLSKWSSILLRGIRRGVLLEFLACKLFGSYKLISQDAQYDYVRNRRGILFVVPKTFSARARADYFYTLDPLTELSIHPFFAMKEGVFVDVGAFLGKYSLEIAKRPGCKVLGIEPNPESAAILKKNALLNNCSRRLTIAPYAVTETSRTVTLSLDGSTSQVVRANKSSTTVTVKGLPILSILKQYKVDPRSVTLLKIDVEGEQLAILEQVLRSEHFENARIICEILADKSRAKTLQFIHGCGYGAEALDDSNYLIVRA